MLSGCNRTNIWTVSSDSKKTGIWGNKMDNKEAGKLTVAALRNAQILGRNKAEHPCKFYQDMKRKMIVSIIKAKENKTIFKDFQEMVRYRLLL